MKTRSLAVSTGDVVDDDHDSDEHDDQARACLQRIPQVPEQERACQPDDAEAADEREQHSVAERDRRGQEPVGRRSGEGKAPACEAGAVRGRPPWVWRSRASWAARPASRVRPRARACPRSPGTRSAARTSIRALRIGSGSCAERTARSHEAPPTRVGVGIVESSELESGLPTRRLAQPPPSVEALESTPKGGRK